MKYLIASIVLMGCVDGLGDPELRTFDIHDYIEDSCIGESDRQWYITDEFTGLEMRHIADSIDHMNDTFDTDIQLCGVLLTEPLDTTNVIMIGVDDIKAFGYYTRGANGNGDTIMLWPDRCKHDDHFQKVVRHELGHALRRDGRHLTEGKNVMRQGWTGVMDCTDDDIAFIQEGL